MAHQPQRAALRFEEIDQPRAHEFVAEQIRRQITLRLIPMGSSLPPERELAKMFGVGRATVQEALDLLASEGLVESRRGRHGGTFVVGPAPSNVPDDVVLQQIRSNQGVVESALVFRLAVEPATAAEAARRRTGVDLARIQRAAEAGEKADVDAEFMRWDTEVHLSLGRATHNDFFADAIQQIRLTLVSVMVALPDSPLWHERSCREHRTILEAIRERDDAAAEAAMLEHVRHTDESIKALLAAL